MDILAFRAKVDDLLLDAGLVDDKHRNRIVTKIAEQAIKYAGWFVDEVHRTTVK